MTALRIFQSDKPTLRFQQVTGRDTEFVRFLELRRERKEADCEQGN